MAVRETTKNAKVAKVRLGDVAWIDGRIPFPDGEKVWLLNLDMIEQQSGRLISKNIVARSEVGSSTVGFDENCVLYSKLRPNLNKVLIPTEPGVATSEILPLRYREDVLGGYLCCYLRSPAFVSYAVGRTAGAKMPRLGSKDLLAAQLPLPPLPEQKRIAEELDRICELKKNAEERLALMDQLVKSRFVEMFGDPLENMKYQVVPIGDLCEVKSGGTPDRKKPEYWQGGGIPWVKTTELQNCIISDTQEKITDAGMQCSSAKLVPPETILIAMYGQGKTRGMTGFLNISATTNQACACLLPGTRVIQKYLWQYLILSYDRLRNLAQGAGQPNLNGKMIKEFAAPLPPKSLQEQFVAFVEQVDKSKFILRETVAQMETLYKAKLQEYFG